MTHQKRIETDRLLLRPFQLQDAREVQRLAGEFEVADTTLNIPHPYKEGQAEAWIRTHQEKYEKKEEIVFAIELQANGQLIGAISLFTNRKHENAEMGYWIGKSFWNNGYATEAAKAMLSYSFEELKLERIHAHYFSRNPASGRVMQKLSMRHEGTLRRHVKKWNKLEDIESYGILRQEFIERKL